MPGVPGLARNASYKVMMAYVSVLWGKCGGGAIDAKDPSRRTIYGANRCFLAYQDVSLLFSTPCFMLIVQ